MKTTYWLPCPCGRKLPVQTTQAGATVRCICGADLVVPALHDMSRLELAEPEDAVPAHRAKPAWDKRQSRILLGAVVALISGGLMVYLEISKPRLRRVDSLAPIQVWTLWQDLRRGPDRHLAPAEKEFLASLARYRTGKTVLLVCITAGLLLMAVFYATPASRPPPRTIPDRAPSRLPPSEGTSNADL